VPFHLQQRFARLDCRRGALPHAERAADTGLGLPISAELTEVQQSAVVNEVVGALRL
jgi:dTDP-4-amino-4,6-dideoxygalactose transaminase